MAKMPHAMSFAAILQTFGNPPSIEITETPVPEPGPGELLIEMLYAPVNPADLNILEGKYGELPQLPAFVGNEGAGRVAAKGAGVAGFETGDLVLPMCRGTWRRHLVARAGSAIRLPGGTPPQQAAMLSVNPPTAALMLREFQTLKPGDWVVQNAANSGVGRSVIQLCREAGVHTFNVVRREELIPELEAMGADVVITEEQDAKEALRSRCGGARPLLGLNAVGGASALNVANLLGPGGTLVTFGGMGRQPLKIPIGLLIFKDLSFRGFWLTRWLKTAPAETVRELFAGLSEKAAAGKLVQPVGEVFPLARLPEALQAAAGENRNGKILLDLHA